MSFDSSLVAEVLEEIEEISVPKTFMESIAKQLEGLTAGLKEVQKQQQELSANFMSLKEAMTSRVNDSPDQSSSSSSNHNNQLDPVFVTVDDASNSGEKHELRLPPLIVSLLVDAGTDRGIVRILLRNFYGIKDLQNMTLTGTSKSTGNEVEDIDEPGSTEKGTIKLPHVKVQLIHAAIKRLSPVPDVLQADAKAYGEALLKQEKDCRAHIRHVLNYFKTAYDVDGNRKPVKKTKSTEKKGKKRSAEDGEASS